LIAYTPTLGALLAVAGCACVQQPGCCLSSAKETCS